jgi:hypothetical protein
MSVSSREKEINTETETNIERKGKCQEERWNKGEKLNSIKPNS